MIMFRSPTTGWRVHFYADVGININGCNVKENFSL